MREKLIKLLKRTEYQFTMSHSLTVENVADDLIQQGVTIATDNNVDGKWIPVTERLPEPETDVLTFSGGCIDIITYRYNRRGLACFMFRDDCGYWKETFVKITHWMPLPSTEGLK